MSLDSELDERCGPSLQAHLAACPACRAFAADLGRLGTALDAATVIEPRPGFAGRVTARIAHAEDGDATAGVPKTGWLQLLRPLPMGVGVTAFCAGMSLVVLANGQAQAEADASQARDAITLLADQYLGIETKPALEDELVDLLPLSED
jgi:anti-sigma factor RsiW